MADQNTTDDQIKQLAELIKTQSESMTALAQEVKELKSSAAVPDPMGSLSSERDYLRGQMDDGLFDRMDSYFSKQRESDAARLQKTIDDLSQQNSDLHEQLGNNVGKLKQGMFGVQDDDAFDKLPVQDGLPFTWGDVKKQAIDRMDKKAVEKYQSSLEEWRKSRQGEATPTGSQARSGEAQAPQSENEKERASADFLASRNDAILAVSNGQMTREDFDKQFSGNKAA